MENDTARHDGWEGLLDLGWHFCMYPIVTNKNGVCKYHIYILVILFGWICIYIHINIVEVSPTILFRLCARRWLIFGWIQHLGRCSEYIDFMCLSPPKAKAHFHVALNLEIGGPWSCDAFWKLIGKPTVFNRLDLGSRILRLLYVLSENTAPLKSSVLIIIFPLEITILGVYQYIPFF